MKRNIIQIDVRGLTTLESTRIIMDAVAALADNDYLCILMEIAPRSLLDKFVHNGFKYNVFGHACHLVEVLIWHGE